MNILRTIVLAAVAVFAACNRSTEPVRVLRVWHFWSEPAQQREFRKLLDQFERTHPGIRIETTPLQWSDGKAKLQIAFSSGTPPDVVHLGAEWITEFMPVLRQLDSTLVQTLRPEIVQFGRIGGTYYAVPWTVNARVLVVHRALGVNSNTTWNAFVAAVQRFHSPPQRYGIGLCISDPHNVLKRNLPLMWATGSHVFRTLPLSTTIDTMFLAACAELEKLVPFAAIEQSRQLDERLRRGQIGAVLTGTWMLADAAVRATYDVLSVIPHRGTSDGASILSGDCYAIARSTAHPGDAEQLLSFLSTWERAAQFCREVPDAGFPAQRVPSQQVLDTLLMRSSQWRNAYEQTFRSCVLPPLPYFLDAERDAEEVIAALLYGKLNPHTAHIELTQRINRLEQTWRSQSD
ncbi:MAG: extracellular solute-binding protein [Chlorobi bacterium]|nr:extracellular solute-binding protein [Chlorobiota bacterium]